MTDDELIEKLREAMNEAGYKPSVVKLGILADRLLPLMPGADTIAEVSVAGTRAVVSGVEAYGLELGVDANGRASTVRFPDGATWTE